MHLSYLLGLFGIQKKTLYNEKCTLYSSYFSKGQNAPKSAKCTFCTFRAFSNIVRARGGASGGDVLFVLSGFLAYSSLRERGERERERATSLVTTAEESGNS